MEKYAKRFKDTLADSRIITVNLVMLIKSVFLGILGAEIWRLSFVAAGAINRFISFGSYEYKAFLICGLYGLVLFFYLFVRGVFADGKKILASGRLDLLIALSFGVWLSIAWRGFFSAWYTDFVASMSVTQLLTVVSGPLVLGLLVAMKSMIWKEFETNSSFIVDLELHERKYDLLNFTEKANRFAERVFNGGSPDSFVFGVDAPWGIGKSTFINFCKEYWKEKHVNETVVYQFSPLRHSGANDILDVFIDGLIHAIQKDSFVPEIKPLISRYSRLLKEVRRFSIFGLIFPMLTADYTADEACDDLSAVLKRFQKKVIIVVDDLDRISFSEIKDILFVIRKSFVFPNVSYVLCYDTENITAMESESANTEKISEFLEKFVNIKISLYLDREDLANYVSANLDKALSTSLLDPLPIRQAIGGLLDIYKSPAYHNYLPFIGDVRKLKRLINTVVMFELETTDFENSDFDKGDLIHLLLIYIHYPNLFRKIYDTETKGGRGFFSLVIPYDDGYPKDSQGSISRTAFSDSVYKNSDYYIEFLEQLPKESHQRFLLQQVFDVGIKLKDARIDSVPEDVRTSLACFNGGWANGRNLETYLDLIVKLSKPVDVGQHRFYANWKDKISGGSIEVAQAFADSKFDHRDGEYAREKLWRILVNGARGLNKETAASIISHLLETIPEYSLLELKEENAGLGLRHSLDYFLTRLLNDSGWTDSAGKHSNNTEENIVEIAEWVFGDGRHLGNGVLNRLAHPERGVLGLHDLLLFRLSCSADRGGDIFDLTRAIARHADAKAPSEGNTQIIAREEMREISQKVFEIFKAQYIDPQKNIFDEISALQTVDFVGKYENYLQSKISEGVFQKSDIDKKIIELKTRVGSFIIYQLGNYEISHGVGCGYYDPEGKEDKHKIGEIINDYLFDLCFHPKETKNAEYFIDYLFRNFASALASAREDGLRYVPTINEFTKVLDRVKLATFWQRHGDTIKGLNLENRDKIVFVGDSEASYMQYVPMVYKVLDDNLLGVENEAKKVVPQKETSPTLELASGESDPT